MPFLRFQHPAEELNARLTRSFYREVLARGVLLHPRHMWFISLAHTRGDISRTLEVVDAAMRVAQRELD
jgi:glutamate-1-semialdehyde aminotransferase